MYSWFQAKALWIADNGGSRARKADQQPGEKMTDLEQKFMSEDLAHI